VRGKRLNEVDETKLALAVWMLARKLVVDGTEQEPASADVATGHMRQRQAEQPRAEAKEAA
jgi:hypothetical protein